MTLICFTLVYWFVAVVYRTTAAVEAIVAVAAVTAFVRAALVAIVAAIAVIVADVVAAFFAVAIGDAVAVAYAHIFVVGTAVVFISCHKEGFVPVFVEKGTSGALGAFNRQLVVRTGPLVVVAQIPIVGRQDRDVRLCPVVRGGRVSQGFWRRRGDGRGDARWRLGCCAAVAGGCGSGCSPSLVAVAVAPWRVVDCKSRRWPILTSNRLSNLVGASMRAACRRSLVPLRFRCRGDFDTQFVVFFVPETQQY